MYFGIDTSNYKTSAAVFDGRCVVSSASRLLPVRPGELGVRQNEAVFLHVKQLPDIIRETGVSAADISAVGVSTRPVWSEKSYMPCFMCGSSTAAVISSLTGAPVYEFSHQQGHIAAAAYGAGVPEILEKRFIAFHLSGGTTEALLVTPDEQHIISAEKIASSLDLKAGQAIDRVGVMLSLPFPAGPYLEKLADGGKCPRKPHPVIKGRDCCLSGLENICTDMKNESVPPCDIAKFCIEYITETICAMVKAIRRDYPCEPLLFAGGVSSNTTLKKRLTNDYGAVFAPVEYSGDNAAGIAFLAALAHKRR